MPGLDIASVINEQNKFLDAWFKNEIKSRFECQEDDLKEYNIIVSLIHEARR